MNTVIKYLKVYISLIVIFLISLILVCLIPSSNMKYNVQKSADELVREGNLYYVQIGDKKLLLDNYSNGLMLNTAYSIDSKDPLYSALVARKNYIPGMTKVIYQDAQFELRSASKYDRLNQVGELYDTVNDDIEESFEYARYWHGYLIYLRPLLILFDYQIIRILLINVLAILAVIFLYLIYKKTNIIMAVIFGISLITIDYYMVGFSIHYTSVFLISMLACIYIMKKHEKIKDILLIFFIIGALTNFFDLLTIPLITLGLPLIVYFLVLQKTEELNIKQTIMIIIKSSIGWGIGYILIWFSKWLITDIVCNRDVIKSGYEQFTYRLGVNEVSEKIPYKNIIKR